MADQVPRTRANRTADHDREKSVHPLALAAKARGAKRAIARWWFHRSPSATGIVAKGA
jgi:hypothetical protein